MHLQSSEDDDRSDEEDDDEDEDEDEDDHLTSEIPVLDMEVTDQERDQTWAIRQEEFPELQKEKDVGQLRDKKVRENRCCIDDSTCARYQMLSFDLWLVIEAAILKS